MTADILERLKAHAKNLELSNYYSNSPPVRPLNPSDLRALIEAYQAVREALTPMPIEDAPRDGYQILAFTESDALPVILYWGHVGRYTNTPKMWLGHESGALQDNDITYYIPLTGIYDWAFTFHRAATTGDTGND